MQKIYTLTFSFSKIATSWNEITQDQKMDTHYKLRKKQKPEAVKMTSSNYICKPKDKIDAFDLKIIRCLSRDCRAPYRSGC